MADSDSQCCDTNVTSCCGSEAKEICICKLTQPAGKFDLKKVLPLVDNPQYIRKCCGRLANSEEHLCNPEPLGR